MVLGNSLTTVGFTVDTIWVGRLGTASIAAVGVGGIAIMIVMTALMGLTVGMRAMVARFVGAGDYDAAKHVARQSFAVSLSLALLVALTGALFAKQILGLFGVAPEVVTEGVPYLRIMLLATTVMATRLTAEAVMQASGDAVNPMRIAVSLRAVHLVLSPCLVFGWWLFPRMGIVGTAAANAIAESLGVALGLWVLLSGRSRLRLTLSGFRLDFGIILRMVRIGLPALISGLQRSLSNLVMIWLMAPFGTVAVAAHTLNQRVEMVLFLPSLALGMASGVLVGQNLGARQPDRAERSAWMATLVAEGAMLIASAAILLWAEGIAGVFTSDPQLVAQASDFLRIAVAGYAFLGVMAVLMNALAGAGDTVPTMIISVAVLLLVTLPLAYVLPNVGGLGAHGVRWAMVSGMVLPAAAFAAYFRMGRWKSRTV
jgi:putative MATE family efflux protein